VTELQKISTAIQKYGPTGYHVHVRFPISNPLGAESATAVGKASEALEVVKTTPCEIIVDAQLNEIVFSFYNLPIPDAKQAIERATYVLQEALPRGRFLNMLVNNDFTVDTQPLGL
jgi:hypothetical protein